MTLNNYSQKDHIMNKQDEVTNILTKLKLIQNRQIK